MKQSYIIVYNSEGMNLEEDTKYVSFADSPAEAYRQVYDYLAEEDEEWHYNTNGTFADFLEDFCILMQFDGKFVSAIEHFNVLEVS